MSLRARDPLAAARSAVPLLVVCAVAVAAWTLVEAGALSAAGTAVSWAVVGLLAAAAALFRLVPAGRLDRVRAGAVAAVTGVLLVCGLRLVTADTSAAAHAFLTFPVLWSAVHLRRGGVVLVTGVALAADAATALLLLPLGAALTDLVFSGGVLVVVAVVLHRAAATQARLVAALQEQADVDALTGLVNRRVFDQALAGQRARRTSSGTALLLIDVDTFKQINDAHGHPVGDAVLVHLAGVLREQVRADDAVLSRLGGDELAVLLPDCPADVAAERAGRVHEAVRGTPLRLADGTALPLSVSLGVAHTAGSVLDVRDLYSAADRALYAAKRAGRGRVAVAPAVPPRPTVPRRRGVHEAAPSVG
ncbi:diguanylate cyclase (GGDEF) domain-containing protein [Geodermatophilus telluris]|uniref:Diguanylate cyclase (GGDEF) domain-containing protein n=1 Tax=Geodermatophilus telluris TaxID=1190417 RepID=A0A1G6TI04_9ACTN|nr:GGDEF domain-containing protein [Geodermatophilus telluris]SDD28649.1 diguanylate cyclase (GGDEF) domain-containing protein [Geodermatophilus telluris]